MGKYIYVLLSPFGAISNLPVTPLGLPLLQLYHGVKRKTMALRIYRLVMVLDFVFVIY